MSKSILGVVLVDPLPVVRAGLARLVSEHPQLELQGQAADTGAALSAIRSLASKKDVVVLVSINLTGDQDAMWLIRRIRELYPTLRVLAMGAHADQSLVSRALFVGADGFADHSTEPREFVDAVVSCGSGEMVVTGAFGGRFEQIVKGIESHVVGSKLLSKRERQVLEIAAQGLTAREIGESLGLAERTVTTHLSRIYSKLEVSSRGAAIRAARQLGMLKPALRIVS